ncbi:MAG: xanthine dehydrogenase FAD-binding subunit XdhB [Treponema sp.]|jgi:xanthine dehydrogenase FAD-binding subunit|nr:xanthine dehydrogenase FAD-binding subunit XdhB [Treponema sp.]
MYDIKEIFEAENPAHAVTLLQEHPEAKIIAGGSDVLIEIRDGKLAGCTLVSIQKIDELRGVSIDANGSIRIGALTSFSHVASDPVILKYIPVLAEAVQTIGGPQLRNIGTIGGNVCNGVTSADSASTLLAFDAVMEYLGTNGIRLVPIGEHYVTAGKTSLAHDEILQAILIPKESYENCFGNYFKYAMRNALDIATLGCSANVRLSADKRSIERLRLAFGVAGPVPMRASGAEKTAAGKAANAETAAAAAQATVNDINPRTSWRASKEFRLHLAQELAKRTITESLKRAGAVFSLTI